MNTRNFCIIAHIDHGKSTLADRLMERTGAVTEREMRDQLLDSMDIERERGITIKAQSVQLTYEAQDGNAYLLHLIDTPGHVDFSYEVSRSLAACEGAILLVDAAQGVQAQTLANAYLAIEAGLDIIPVLNKIDLPAADPDRAAAEIVSILGGDPDDVLRVSAKTGAGIDELLERMVEVFPPPGGDPAAPLRALVFDSYFDSYRGVVCSVRIVDGSLARGNDILFMATGERHSAAEVGVLNPRVKPVDRLGCGVVGYLISGVKELDRIRRTSRFPDMTSRSRWCTRGCSRPKATTSSDSGKRSRSSSSTTPRSCGNRKAPVLSDSVFGVDSWDSSTWRSSASVWSGSTTSTSSPQPRRWPGDDGGRHGA